MIRSLAIGILALTCAACEQRAGNSEAVTKSDTSGPEAPQRPIDVAALKEAFASKSTERVADVTNEALGPRSTPGVLDFLHKVWEGNRDATVDLDPEFLNQLSVRVFVANVLAQAKANRMIEIETGPLLTVLRSGLDATDREVVWAAMSGLEPYADNADVDKFVAIAGGDSLPNARVAIGAVAGVCGDYAKQSLDRLISSGKSKVGNAEAQDIYKSAGMIRNSRCRGG